MSTGQRFKIGTSGWHYDHWLGAFYPSDMDKQDFLAYYAQKFDVVEVNNSFYQLPEESTLVNWRDSVPENFSFAVKASRYITHMKKLKEPRESLDNFIQRIRTLSAKLGPILFQLPPHWRANLPRLESFLEMLPGDLAYTFEFRDPSWFNPEVYARLADHHAAFCIYDLDQTLSPKELTAGFVYIRLHGPNGAYQGKYTIQDLARWAGAFHAWARAGKRVYCFFDNDQRGYAPQNALELVDMLT